MKYCRHIGCLSPTSGEIIAYCRERLAEYKVPKSAVGKVLRRLLREQPSNPYDAIGSGSFCALRAGHKKAAAYSRATGMRRA